MPFEDHHAAATLRDLREDAGLSVERLAESIRRKAEQERWYKLHGAVDADTLRRIEDTGHCPSERIRLVIALFFDRRPRDIWRPENRLTVEAGTGTGIGWRTRAAA